jgi:ribosomal protein S18 acetylase RimI-like enzyme
MADPFPFTIQNANWRDLTELRQLEQECFGQDAWPLWDLVGVLTMPGIVRLKASVNEQMAGFISGETRHSERVGWVTTLGVHAQNRRMGIAMALLEECEQRLNMPRVRLSLRRSNYGALRLYEQAGYSMVDVWLHYYSGGEDALVMEKKR